MFKVLEESEPKKLKNFLPRIYLFKWYEITLRFLLTSLYFILTAFLIWRRGKRLPQSWIKLGDEWTSKKPLIAPTGLNPVRAMDTR